MRRSTLLSSLHELVCENPIWIVGHAVAPWVGWAAWRVTRRKRPHEVDRRPSTAWLVIEGMEPQVLSTGTYDACQRVKRLTERTGASVIVTVGHVAPECHVGDAKLEPKLEPATVVFR